MIEFLFSALLVPVLPELADPTETHAVAIKEIDKRLTRSREGAELPADASTPLETLTSNQPELPVITGGLFGWSKVKPVANQGNADVASSPSIQLRLTGLMDISGQRVAILNDGAKDHVVGVGSYVLDTYQVVALGPKNAVLKALGQGSGAERLELNLMPGELPRGL